MLSCNFYDDIIKLKFIIYQILYNIDIIKNELDYYEDRYYLNIFKDMISKITSETIENIKYFYLDDLKYYRIETMLYMELNNVIYWKEKNIYYKKNIDLKEQKQEIDKMKTFISLNDKIFKTNNFVLVLEGIVNLINYMEINFQTFIECDNYNIKFINNKGIPYKIINISYIFYRDNNKFNLKDLNEFLLNDIIIIQKFGNFLKYIYNEFKFVKFDKLMK